MPSTRNFIAATIGALLVACASAAHARAPIECAQSNVRIEGPIPKRWVHSLGEACRDLSELEDVDLTASVRIRGEGDDLVVEVALPDGRRTRRTVRKEAALQPTLHALLLVPSYDVEITTEPPPESSPAEVVPDTPAPPRPSPPPVRVAASLGVGGGARIAAESYASLAANAFAELTVDRWLIGTTFRWDVVQDTAGRVMGFEMETVTIGLEAGYVLPLPFGAVDLGLCPRLLSETQTFENTSGETTRGAMDVRLGAFSRLRLGHSHFRPAIELDADLSPARLRREIRLDPLLPPLPSWSAGIGLALVWGAP